MNTMHGALASACWNRSRIRAAPTPTNISTNSEPLRLKNGTCASPATARASSVLPVPGRADEEDALGNAPAEVRVFLGILQELDDLLQLVFRLVDARDIRKTHLHFIVRVDLRAAAGERHHAAFRAAHSSEEESPDGDEEDQRKNPAEHFRQPAAGYLAQAFDALYLRVPRLTSGLRRGSS